MSRINRNRSSDSEFLWLISLSDLMILLFTFFVVLFSFTYKKLGAADFRKISESFAKEKSEAAPLDEIQARLLKWVVSQNLLEQVTVEQKEDALILNIREKVLFGPGQFSLDGPGSDLVTQLGQAIGIVPRPYRIGIEGHTDDMPFKNGDQSARDNWELSVRRSHAVLLGLGLNEDQLKRTVLMGYADNRPMLPNRDEKTGKANPENQSKNRRVTLRIF